jgi:HMG (high mobility group) box
VCYTLLLQLTAAAGTKALSETALARLAGVKGPKNAFILFSADVRAELKASGSTAASSGIGALAQEIGARWKNVSPDDKASHNLLQRTVSVRACCNVVITMCSSFRYCA